MQPRILSSTLLSLGLHIGTAYLIAARFPGLGFPSHWQGEALGAVAASALLALLPVGNPSRGLLAACLTLRIFLFALLALPLGGSLWLVLGLAFALILDAGARLSPTAGTAFGAMIAALSLLRALVPFHAWGLDVSGSLTAENLSGFLALGLVLLLAHEVSALRMVARKDADLARQLNDSILSLTNANQGFLTYASEVERASILTERNHLTREMHDVLSHTLTNLRMMMEAALRRDWEDKDELHRLHQWTRDQAQQGLQDMRSILHLIRSMEEPEVKGVRQVQNLIRTFMEATNVAVVVDWGNIPWSWQSDYVNITVFRIIQESMTNAFRHGHATEISIYFFQGPSALNIRIEDNGSGSVDFKKGIGLASMEERLKPIEGTLSVYSADSGFRLHVRIPTGAYLSIAEA
jgi:signal transduction histidine kinase